MTVSTQKEKTRLTVKVDGKLGTTAAPELEKAIRNNIFSITELVLDLEKVDYIASAGLRVILSAAKTMRKQGSMKIVHVTPNVMEVFAFTGLASALEIEEL